MQRFVLHSSKARPIHRIVTTLCAISSSCTPEEKLVSARARKTALPKSYYRKYEAEIDRYDKSTNPNGCAMFTVSENCLTTDLLMRKYNSVPPPSPKDAVYANYKGTPQLRKALADKLFPKYFNNGLSVSPEEIIIGVGAGVLINQLLWVLADPGASVMIPAPYYMSFKYDVQARNDLNIVPIRRDAKTNYRLTKESLEETFRLSTAENGHEPKVLLLCSPENPLGRVFTPDEIAEVVAWAATKPNLHLVSDELYALSVFGKDAKFTSVMGEVRDYPELRDQRTHVVWAFSKDFGASGFRVGAIHTRNHAVHDAFANLAYFSAVPNPVQLSFAELIDDEEFVEHYVEENKRRLGERYEHLCSLLDQGNISFYPAESGLFVWLDLRGLLTKSEHNANTFEAERDILFKLRDLGVWLAPGESFRSAAPGYFRLCFAQVGEAELQVGIARLAKACKLESKL